jgi:hypothetical protein
LRQESRRCLRQVSGEEADDEGKDSIMKITLTLALLIPTLALAQQRQTTFRDASGREIGRSVSDGRTTTFRDTMGREVARSVTNGNRVITFDAMSRQTGSTTKGR